MALLTEEPRGLVFADGSTYQHVDLKSCMVTQKIFRGGHWKTDKKVPSYRFTSDACTTSWTDRPQRSLVSIDEFESIKRSNPRGVAGDSLWVLDQKQCYARHHKLLPNGEWKDLNQQVKVETEFTPAEGCFTTEVTNSEVTPPPAPACKAMHLDVKTSTLSSEEIAALGDKLPYHSTGKHPLGALTIGQDSDKVTVSDKKTKQKSQVQIVHNGQVSFKIKISGILGEADFKTLGHDLNKMSAEIRIKSRKYMDYIGRSRTQADTEILCLLGDEQASEGRCSGKPLTKSDAKEADSDWTDTHNPWLMGSIQNQLYSSELTTLINSSRVKPNRIEGSVGSTVELMLATDLGKLLNLDSAGLVKLLTSHQKVPGERELFFTVADDDFVESAELQITVPCSE